MSEPSTEIIKELRESYEKMGPVRKVIRTQFGIASGNTRLKAGPNWPETYKEVKDYFEHLKIMVADNISEHKKRVWWENVLSDAAKELMKQGVEKGQISARLCKDFPLSDSSIYSYLPQEFKSPEKVKAGEASGAARGVLTTDSGMSAPTAGAEPIQTGGIKHKEIEESKEEPAKITEPKTLEDLVKLMVDQRDKGLSYRDHYRNPLWATATRYSSISGAIDRGSPIEDILAIIQKAPPKEPTHAGTATAKQYTSPQMHFANALAREHLVFEIEVPFERPEKTQDGKPKSFVVDLLLDRWLVVEIEGIGSSSADNIERDKFLEDQGLTVMHISNEEAVQNTQHHVNCIKMLLDGKKRQLHAINIRGEALWLKFVQSLDGGQAHDLFTALREDRLKDGGSCPLCGLGGLRK